MKKSFILILAAVWVMGAAFSFAAGDSGEDYKVIKNAVNKGGNGQASLLRVSIKDKKNNQESVEIKLPIALVELFANSDSDILKDAEFKKHCNMDLKKMMEVLRESGPMTLVEISDEDSLIKVWFE